MQFRIADTFTDSLARLTGDEQKAVKTTAFDVQLNTAKLTPSIEPCFLWKEEKRSVLEALPGALGGAAARGGGPEAGHCVSR
jgi:hypothetical protein